MKLTDTLSLTEVGTGGNTGFWLYDRTRGMNLSMRAKSEQAAFVEALTYYQKRLQEVEKELKGIKSKVYNFIEAVEDLE
jgi:hypothetical protein